MIRTPIVLAALAGLAAAAPARAQDQAQPGAGRIVVIGAGVEVVPKYPGAASGRLGVLPLIDTWRADRLQPAESPDETISFALRGERGSGLSAGPSFTFASGRSERDLPGLPAVGSSVEVGGFVEAWPVPAVRLRADLRQGLGGHKALLGELAGDAVWRGPGGRTMLTAGPRLRWGSGRYNRAFFAVPAANTAGLAAFTPAAGVYSYGMAAGLRVPLTAHLGLYTYGRYDRLTDRVAASPIVQAGSADQLSGGVALTYRFGL